MPAAQPAIRRTSPFIVWPVCLLILFVLYLASLGPVVWLWSHDVISGDTVESIFETVYYPVFLIDEKTDFFDDNAAGLAYSEYVEWWDR